MLTDIASIRPRVRCPLTADRRPVTAELQQARRLFGGQRSASNGLSA
ncbi:MAG: hypothetical protein H6633_08440 [Anaerolineales bacterium]|nr:hypothetical protein [Anaerolineales bacterium]